MTELVFLILLASLLAVASAWAVRDELRRRRWRRFEAELARMGLDSLGLNQAMLQMGQALLPAFGAMAEAIRKMAEMCQAAWPSIQQVALSAQSVAEAHRARLAREPEIEMGPMGVKRHGLGDAIRGVRLTACKAWVADATSATSDPEEITCLRCRKALGLPMRRERPQR